jgi:hypothetical protein
LATDRKLSAGTINSYLAGVRQLHVARGLPAPDIRSDVVKLVLKGIKNKDNRETQKEQRQKTNYERNYGAAETAAERLEGQQH